MFWHEGLTLRVGFKNQGLRQDSEAATINRLPCELTLLQADSLISWLAFRSFWEFWTFFFAFWAFCAFFFYKVHGSWQEVTFDSLTYTQSVSHSLPMCMIALDSMNGFWHELLKCPHRASSHYSHHSSFLLSSSSFLLFQNVGRSVFLPGVPYKTDWISAMLCKSGLTLLEVTSNFQFNSGMELL